MQKEKMVSDHSQQIHKLALVSTFCALRGDEKDGDI